MGNVVLTFSRVKNVAKAFTLGKRNESVEQQAVKHSKKGSIDPTTDPTVTRSICLQNSGQSRESQEDYNF